MTPGGAHPTRWVTRTAWAGLLILCAGPIVAAFVPLLSAPSESLAQGLGLLTSARLWGLWGKTCAIALGTALTALLLGAPLGFWLAALPPRARRWMGALLAFPLLLPTHVLAVAWIDVLGEQGLLAAWGLPRFSPYSSAGVVLVQALGYYPIPLFATLHRLRHQDPAIREAAQTLSPAGPIFWRLSLPLLFPALATGGLLVFVLSLLSFSVPSLLQIPVFTVEIFSSFNSLLDQRQAVMLAAPLVVTGTLVAWLVHKLHRRHPNNGVAQADTVGPPLSPCRRAGLFAVVLLTVALPGLALFRRVGTASALFAAWQTGASEIGVSVFLGTVGATLLLVLVVPLALWPGRHNRAVIAIAGLAYLVSGPVFGTGLIQLWNHPGPPGYLYDHVYILLIAVVGRYALFAWLGCRLVVTWLPPSALDAARNLGAGSWRVTFRIALPLLKGPLVAVWACLFLQIMGEVECIVLVAPPGWVPVSLRIFTLMHYGPTATVSALALLQGGAALAALALCTAITDRNRVYTPAESRYHTHRRG